MRLSEARETALSMVWSIHTWARVTISERPMEPEFSVVWWRWSKTKSVLSTQRLMRSAMSSGESLVLLWRLGSALSRCLIASMHREEEGLGVVGEQFGTRSEFHFFGFLSELKGIFARVFGVLDERLEDIIEV